MNMEHSEGQIAALSLRPTYILVDFAYEITCAVNLQFSDPGCLKSPLYEKNICLQGSIMLHDLI
jgi:hypothetical protein